MFYSSLVSGENKHGSADEPMTSVHLNLGKQAEQLLAATDRSEMIDAAKGLRLTALGVRRLLVNSLLTETSLQMDPSLPDPEQRRSELADLAVDVVTAADYLLSLLVAPAVTAPRLILANEFDARGSYQDEENFRRLTRQQLDARGTAVRLGTRLLSGFQGDVATASSRSD
jgi:hypothetical protein